MLLEYKSGAKFKICFWVEADGSCPALEFLQELQADQGERAQDGQTFEKRLESFAQHGPPCGKERCRLLVGSEKIYELKAPHGSRLAFFYDTCERAIVVFSHGFDHPVSNRAYKPHYERAEDVREVREAEFAREQKSGAQKSAPAKARKSSRKSGR